LQRGEYYLVVIDSLNVLQMRTSLNVAKWLIENLYKFKGYGAKNSKFSKKNVGIFNGLN